MNQGVQLIKTASRALDTLDFERRCNVSSPRLDRLRERNRLVVSRELRRAVAATITEIDTALMQNLMQIVKKLSRGVTNGHNRQNDPADVTLKIMLGFTRADGSCRSSSSDEPRNVRSRIIDSLLPSKTVCLHRGKGPHLARNDPGSGHLHRP